MRVVPILVVVALIAGCLEADDEDMAEPTDPPQAPGGPFTLASDAFGEGEPIPAEYTCDGENVNPALSFRDAPLGTATFALVMDDPDAPLGTVLHWTFWDLPVGAPEIPRAADMGSLGATEGNDYGGPCPPDGEHRYFFHAYAVNTTLGLAAGSSREQLESALAEHGANGTQLMGTYNRLPIDLPVR